MPLDILLVDDEPTLLAALGDLLEDCGHSVKAVPDGSQAVAALSPGRFDLVLTDVRLPGPDGHEIARRALGLVPKPAVILMTAYGEVPNAVAMLKLGARDYLTKPVSEDRLLEHVAAVEREMATDSGSRTPGIVACSPEARAMFKLASRVARSDLPILIDGETGSGKEVMARFIHDQSPRHDQAFVAANCSALPPELIDSELFGHTRGAFTGAQGSRVGWLRSADQGTLFLDEVAELPQPAQARLLRALEVGEVRPVGADQPHAVDVRIVAATHANLDRRVAQGAFRKDLLFRLRGFSITVPPLRDRPEDIPPLARRFLSLASKNLRDAPTGIADTAMARLIAWHWPGNIRELKHVIETAVVLADGSTLTESDIRLGLPDAASTDTPLDLREASQQLERSQIRRALALTDGNRSQAAAQLGISRKHLWELMRRHALSD